MDAEQCKLNMRLLTETLTHNYLLRRKGASWTSGTSGHSDSGTVTLFKSATEIKKKAGTM